MNSAELKAKSVQHIYIYLDKVFLLFHLVVPTYMHRMYECGGVYLMRKVVEERVTVRACKC